MPTTPDQKATMSHKPPTRRQINYLKALAERTGQTFTYPHTAAEASREITRLKQTRLSSHGELEIEREIADAVAVGERDAARVRDDEINGYGSSATWAHKRAQEPTLVQDPGPAAPRPRQPAVGKRTELARYTVAGVERVLYGQRVDGVVRVVDRPAHSRPGVRSYLVERGLETNGELDALIADYLAAAQRLRTVPMAEAPLTRYLDHMAS
jgi:hypothetical protein